jgi:plasmid maintenance system killer protein
MNFFQLFNLILESAAPVYNVLSKATREQTSGLYIPKQNVYIETQYGNHAGIYSIMIKEEYKTFRGKFPENVEKILRTEFDRFKTQFKDEFEFERFIKSTNYSVVFAEMGLVRYNIDFGLVSVECNDNTLYDALTVIKKIQEEVRIRNLMFECYKVGSFALDVMNDEMIPTTVNELRKEMHKAKTLRQSNW